MANEKKMKVFVLKDCSVDINGVRTKYAKGLAEIPADHANIIIGAGYAQEAEPKAGK